jgi:hypothetical protein
MKKEKKFFLEANHILFYRNIMIICIGIVILIMEIVLRSVLKAAYENFVWIALIGATAVFLVASIIYYNPFPYLFTVLSIDGTRLVIKRLRKEFIYNFNDIKEIAVVPQYNFKGEIKNLYFAIGKEYGEVSEMKKIASPYFVGEKSFVISRYNMENLEPLFRAYFKECKLINYDGDMFLDEEVNLLKHYGLIQE